MPVAPGARWRKAVELGPSRLALLLKGPQKPRELARLQARQRPQQLGFAENTLQVHAPLLPDAARSIDYKVLYRGIKVLLLFLLMLNPSTN